MGIALASGVPVAAGLITGIVGGIVVGALAGSPLQVSGPAAGLAVLVYEIVERFGLEMLGVIVLIAGVLQVVAGVMKLGQWFRAVSPAVIKGMLAGIGVLIFAGQFHVMVDDKPKGSGIQNLISIPQAIWKGLAIPEFNSREVRRFRTEMQRTVGELHRRQVSLKARIAKRIPHTASENEVESSLPSAKIKISDLASEQVLIAEELAIVGKRLHEFEAPSGNSEKTKRIGEAAIVAFHNSEKALAAIRAGDFGGAMSQQDDAVASLESLLNQQKNHHLAAYIGILTIVLIVLWQGFVPKKWKVVPGPLVAVVVATLAAVLLTLPVLYVEVPDNLWNAVRFPSLTLLSGAPWAALIQAAIMIAVVASAETLLCATATDQMHQGPRTRYDRELFAQGVGNLICGVLGALPMTGVIVRSTANIQAGARTRLSQLFPNI